VTNENMGLHQWSDSGFEWKNDMISPSKSTQKMDWFEGKPTGKP
jgi:hypothetical protein